MVGEAGRGVIREQAAIEGPALPWRDPAAFAEAMLVWDLRSYREACEGVGAVYFDRGLPDIAGYLSLCGLQLPSHLERAIARLRYAPEVFIAPPWPEIYRQDAERRQDAAEAERTYRAMVETYRRFGYRLIELPRQPVEARCRFLLERTAAA